MSFQSLGLSQPVLQALALKDYKRRDPDPDAGHSDPPQGPRPARHRPDRHRQDRGLHAAVDRPAAPVRPPGRPARLPDARPRPDPRAGQPDRRERPRLFALLAAQGRHRVRRHLGRQEPAGRGARRRRARRHARPADRPDRAALPHPRTRSRSSSSTRPTRCSISASSTRSSRSSGCCRRSARPCSSRRPCRRRSRSWPTSS